MAVLAVAKGVPPGVTAVEAQIPWSTRKWTDE